MEDERKTILEKLGFEETKTDLWEKKTGKDYLYWDFRKILRGRFYVSLENKKFESALDSKNRDEYVGFREMQGDDGDEKTMVATKPVITISNKNPDAEIVLRGNETDISNVVQSRRLDMIAKASKAMGKDGLGEGVLYHDLGKKIGFEPSADLIDLISCEMGNIETKIVESGMHRHIDIATGNEYNTCYAIVHAIDTIRGTVGIGSAENVIDYDEMEKTGRSFAFTKVLRKARRNAIERLIPVPRKALVELIKDVLKNNAKK